MLCKINICNSYFTMYDRVAEANGLGDVIYEIVQTMEGELLELLLKSNVMTEGPCVTAIGRILRRNNMVSCKEFYISWW